MAASAPHGTVGVYSGLCRTLTLSEKKQKTIQKKPAMRVKVDGCLVDLSGDFVVKRADGLFAYQLVVVVDDLEQGITDVLRGEDLLDSTSRQQYLAKIIKPDANPLRYFHAPLMYTSDGVKMSKRDGSMSLEEYKNKGLSKQKIVGDLAFSLGLLQAPKPISAQELLSVLELSRFHQSLTQYLIK